MIANKKYFNLISLQIVIWLLVFFMMLISMLQYDTWQQALTYSIIYLSLYIFIIYTNANWLIPTFFKKKKYIIYVLLVLLLITIAVIIRCIFTLYIYNTWFAKQKETLKLGMIISSIFSNMIVFIVSIIFGLAMNYFKLSKVQETIKAEKAAAELGLLKHQLQPHFLFNTLNNIYYEAQKESPVSADLIERLSQIMRYFIEESPKDLVFLKSEIALLENYIDLEKIRFVNALKIEFIYKGNLDNVLVPPLLIMPIVENIFKHGVDKRNTENEIHILLEVKDKRLFFRTQNRIYIQPTKNYIGGVGIDNLRKRLTLYFENEAVFTTKNTDNFFIVEMEMPLYEC